MSALTFNPWALKKTQPGEALTAKPAKRANPSADLAPRLAEVASLAATPDRKRSLVVDPQPMAPIREPRRWSYPADEPLDGDWCACCSGQRFWCEAIAPKGWRCWTCHPPDHLPSSAIREIRTSRPTADKTGSRLHTTQGD
jgi:hypothetical protein